MADGARLFSVVPRDRTRGSGHKLKGKKFYLNTRKNCYTVRVVEHWSRVPRAAAESPFLEAFSINWTRSWAACSSCPCFEQEFGLDDLQRSLPTSSSLISL